MPTIKESEVVRVTRAHRLAMSAREAETMRQMGEAWLNVERSLNANISALANEMARRAASGETIIPSMVRRAERYSLLKIQAEKEIVKYNREAAAIIADGQTVALQEGLQTAQDAIFSSYPSPLSASFNKINLGAVDAMVGLAGDGSPLRTLLNESVSAGAVDNILDALINGVAQGLGADQVARNMAESLGGNFDRSLTIARTEINRSYRSASTEQYRQSGVVVEFMRLVARDEACPACLALDGERFSSASEMDDHVAGRCTCVPVLAGVSEPQWEKAQDWFANQSEDKQREILGAGRFDLYKNGMPLQDMAHKVQNDTWGASPALIPLSELKK